MLRDIINQTITDTGITKAALAQAAGMNRQNLGRWLTGARSSITVETLERILMAVESLTGRKLRFTKGRKKQGAKTVVSGANP